MRPVKLKLIGIISVFAIILITTIGYSALNTNLTISGEAHMRVNSDIRVSSIELVELKNGAYETYGNEYTKNTTSMHVTLPNTNSTAKYKVTVTNKTGAYFSPNEIVEQSKTNSNVTYELSGISSYDVYDDEILTFYVSFSTKQANQKQDLVLEYNFSEITTTVWAFAYTGGAQTFTTPYNADYKIETWGGGSSYTEITTTPEYKGGSYTSGNIGLLRNKNLYIYVGEKGIDKYDYARWELSPLRNFNGGGKGNFVCQMHYINNNINLIPFNLNGAGATDIRLTSGSWDNFNSLKSRIMVAAGAGNFGIQHAAASSGGGLTSDDAGYKTEAINRGLHAGQTYTKGNNAGFGLGGYATYGGDVCSGNDGGGGGSGYYGGGGAYDTNRELTAAGGAGGSSFISGHNGCDAIKESSTSSSIVHTGQSVHYSGYKFVNTVMIDGDGNNWTTTKGSYTGMPTYDGTSTMKGNFDNGYAKITLLPEKIRISNIELVSLTNGAYESSPNGYSKNTTKTNVTLPNTNSTATYKVTITNKTGNYFSLNELLESTNSNSNVKYTINGLEEKNVYQGSEYTFNIALSTSVANQTTNLVLKYRFEEVSTSVWAFDYTGGEQTFNVPYSADYKIETWGAQGGYTSGYESGIGYGGYSSGLVSLSNDNNLYVNIGGAGSNYSQKTISYGGYNGGANGGTNGSTEGFIPQGGSGGGGATHIATKSGLLSTLSNNKDSILIVSGGGGGSAGNSLWETAQFITGGYGGGYIGSSGGHVEEWPNYYATGGTQTSGGNDNAESGNAGTFGQGALPTRYSSYGGNGGGGGYYGGGGSSRSHSGGGGGSGYIGNSLLTNKVMYCYNCTESTATATKTISTTNVSSTPISNYAKKGNGYAKITLIPRN